MHARAFAAERLLPSTTGAAKIPSIKSL